MARPLNARAGERSVTAFREKARPLTAARQRLLGGWSHDVIFEMNRPALALKLHPARVMKTSFAVAACCVATLVSVNAYTPKYRPRVSLIDRQTDFSKVKTYAWLDSHLVADADLHAHIVAAVDREFGALGMTKSASGTSDVVIDYAAYGRTDVAVNAKKIAKNVKPSYGVGILVVSVLAPQTMKPVLELRADTPVDPTERTASVDDTVAAMFRLYPRRRH